MSLKRPTIGSDCEIDSSSIIGVRTHIGNGVRICPEAEIDKDVIIENNVLIGRGARVHERTYIGKESVIGDGCVIGSGVAIGSQTLLMDGAQICPDVIATHSSDARILEQGVSVGPRVFLHNEVELAVGAIVPTQRTIAHLGNLGAKNRVVTIYGSDLGPRFSAGCQIGIPFETLRDRVLESQGSAPSSAETYEPYVPIFNEIGNVVQQAYDAEQTLVKEIKSMRRDYRLWVYLQKT